MNSKRTALCVAIATAAMASSGAFAQDEFGFEDESAPVVKPVHENHIEFGVGYTDDGNGKFGEYNSGVNSALQSDGPFAVGGLRLSSSDSDNATAWQFEAGMGNGRALDAFYKVQGDFTLGFYGDRLEKIEYHKARSPYQGGSNTLLLPAGFRPGTSTRDGAFYSEENIATTRQTFGFDAIKHLSDKWNLSFNAERQDKDGDDTMGGNQGFSGTALLPEPVDYKTDQLTARVEYSEKSWQNGLELYFSQFKNGNAGLVFDNAQFAPIDLEQLALEPDNEFMRIGIDGGYSFDMRTRLSWFADWSRGKQDENFLPVVLDQNFAPRIDPVFIPSSLDGEVERSAFKLALVGRPLARFDYRLEYDYKNRENQHNALPVQLVSGATASSGYSSHLFDKETQSFAAEGGYRFANRFRIRGGMELLSTDRDTTTVGASFTDTTEEDRYWLELKLPSMGSLSAKVRAEYNTTDADLSDETQEFISPGGVDRRATPFFLLERSEDVYEINVDYAFADSVSLYGSFKVIRDDFDNENYGLHDRESEVANFGLSWSPSNVVAMSAYASFEQYELRQIGRQMGATPVPYSEWNLKTEDESDAFGVTLDWMVVEGRFAIKADLAYLESDSSYISSVRESAGIALLTGAMPDSDDQLLRLNIVGNYRFNEQVDVSARYIYESRSANDWAWDSLLTPGVATTASTIGFAYERPDYDSQALIMAVRYKF